MALDPRVVVTGLVTEIDDLLRLAAVRPSETAAPNSVRSG